MRGRAPVLSVDNPHVLEVPMANAACTDTGAHESASQNALMHRIQAGDQVAMDEALDQFWDPLVKYARGFLGSQDAAEDAAQETFVRLWRNRHRWNAAESLRPYLYRVLRNHILNERRAHRVRARWRDQVLRRKSRGPATPVELTEHGELSDAVNSALSALPPRRREVFTLARFHGLSYQEIAAALEISPQTVANQMSAALSALREELAPFLATSSHAHLRLLSTSDR